MIIKDAKLNYRGKLRDLKLGNVFYISVHHSDSRNSSPDLVHEWHLHRGWLGNGYSFQIMKNGDVYECRGYHIGSHTEGYNSTSIGIVLEGNYVKENRIPPAQYDSLIKLIKKIKKDLPNNLKIMGHRDFCDTTCPGNHLYFLLAQIKKDVEKRTDTTLREALEILESNSVINSPNYWLETIKMGQEVNNDYLEILIKNMAKKLHE